MFEKVRSPDGFEKIRHETQAFLAYFSTPDCNVCKVLKPLVAEMVNENFPELRAVFIDIDLLPEIATAHNVFIVPTILVYFNGKEFIRKSRFIGLPDLKADLSRLFNLLYS